MSVHVTSIVTVPPGDTPSLVNQRTVVIAGVGLIGGSLGLALGRYAPGVRRVGFGRRESALQQAVHLGAIDEYSLDLPRAVGRADLLVLCTPVDVIADQTIEALRCAPQQTVVTDCGSVKAAIVRQVENTLPPELSCRFVGGHPLAGSDRTGVEHARSDLFVDRTCILTPRSSTSVAAVDAVYELWSSVGAQVVLMEPEVHDEVLAGTSHLPHIAAAALVHCLDDHAKPFVASGFLDTTRVASSAAEIWVPILLHNRTEILRHLRKLAGILGDFERALQNADADELVRLWQTAAARRRELERSRARSQQRKEAKQNP